MPSNNVLNENFIRKIGGYEHLKNIYLDYYGPFLNVKTRKEASYKFIGLITDDIYRDMLERANSAFSIEPRYPFLDKRLVEFCYGLPSEMKFRFGWDKYILRNAMADILPKEIQWRTGKGGTEEVYYTNFKLFGKDFLKNIIHKDENIKEYVDLDRFEYFYQKLLQDKKGDLTCLWFVSLLSIWLNENKNFTD